MEVDAPTYAEYIIAPDYESDSEQMEKDDKNKSVVESDSESVVLDSAKIMPTFYPQITLNPISRRNCWFIRYRSNCH
jgi:hypothetical protein